MLHPPTRAFIVPLLLTPLACGELEINWEPSGSVAQEIVNGTRAPQNIALTAGQMLAIGYLADPSGSEFCTGTLVEPRKVITARHCVEGESASSMRFGFGTDPSNPTALATLSAVRTGPDGIDFAVLLLAQDATTLAPGVEPLPMNRIAVDQSWIGRWVDASGYGDTYSNTTGRFFASVQIYAYDDETVSVDGHGEQGICYGDSGGPILWQASPSSAPVVVGTEQWGDSSCVDKDHLTRVDLLASWVDGLNVGGTTPVDPSDECDGLDYLGACDGDVALWCQDGNLVERNCGATGSSCGYISAEYGYYCLPVACGATDALGSCVGETLKRCDASNERLTTIDCSARGETCALVDEATGFDCVPPPITPPAPETGSTVPKYQPVDPTLEGGCAAVTVPWSSLAALGLWLRRRRG